MTVKIVRDGYIVGMAGGFLQSGCATTAGATVAVPLRAGAHDTQGLTRCLVTARAHADPREGAFQRQVNLASEGDVPYDVLVQTLDAVRETRPGAADLYTDPVLGVIR